MKKESKTDWARVDAMKDEDIDLSDIPELDDDFFREAVPWPSNKQQITLRLDTCPECGSTNNKDISNNGELLYECQECQMQWTFVLVR